MHNPLHFTGKIRHTVGHSTVKTNISNTIHCIKLIDFTFIVYQGSVFNPLIKKSIHYLITWIGKLSCAHAISLQKRADYFKFRFYDWSDVWRTVMTSKWKIFGWFFACNMLLGKSTINFNDNFPSLQRQKTGLESLYNFLFWTLSIDSVLSRLNRLKISCQSVVFNFG